MPKTRSFKQSKKMPHRLIHKLQSKTKRKSKLAAEISTKQEEKQISSVQSWIGIDDLENPTRHPINSKGK